jgi:hypothetical protein
MQRRYQIEGGNKQIEKKEIGKLALVEQVSILHS